MKPPTVAEPKVYRRGLAAIVQSGEERREEDLELPRKNNEDPLFTVCSCIES
jgi:hypothetical protein